MATQRETVPKRVVYLWGAGATQAEAHRLGAVPSLLMRDTDEFGEGLTTRILRRTRSGTTPGYSSSNGVDIEKLISLFAASGVDDHIRLAEEMRGNYFSELRTSLISTKVRDNPYLAIQLLRMHQNPTFQNEVETLSGIITTNHDGLLQTASQQVFEAVNLGFKFTSTDFTCTLATVPPILQLHGSFTWKFGLPIRVDKLLRTSKHDDTIWIPPTILKESKNYPFNKLSGLAYELLARHCDVLRVVGASLTQNDWNILSLIFNAQRHKTSTHGTAFRIELILPQSAGEWIKKDCAYLQNVTPIGYLTDGHFDEYESGSEFPPDSDMANPFAYWLNEKTEYHRLRDELS